MTNEVIVQKSFEERMIDMMKENVGNLFTPDDLKKIVEKGIEKLYFTPQLKRSNYGTNEYDPSLSEKLVDENIQEQVRYAIVRWMNENPEKILALIESAIKDGMSKRIANAIDHLFQSTFYQFGESIKQQIINIPR